MKRSSQPRVAARGDRRETGDGPRPRASEPAPSDDARIFCRIVAGTAPAERVAERPRAIAFLTIGPLRPGHTLVIPRAHAITLEDVRPADWLAVGRLAQIISAIQRDRLGAAGTTLFLASGSAGEQSVPHLHLHVVPRTEDDGLDLTSWWGPRIRPVERSELAAMARRMRGDADR
jgi:histidine triad (HIT) family protein